MPTMKERLKDGQRTLGCWLGLFNPIAAEIVALSGYDCVVIDMEHGAGSYLEAIPLLQAIKGTSCAPLARVPSNEPVSIKKTLDLGVEGIIIPNVGSVAEAEEALRSCRYPPQGIRGNAAGLVRASDYGLRAEDYQKTANDDLLVILQIESAEGLENVEAIASLPGVDMLFIGPSDLSSTIGHHGDPGHAEVAEAIARIESAAASAGILVGSILLRGRSAAAMARDGYALVVADSDITLLRRGGCQSVETFRKES